MNCRYKWGVFTTLVVVFISCFCIISCREDGQGEEVPSEASDGKLSIVSLSPNVTEIIFALGAGDQLVGVTKFCDYPPEAKEIKKVGGVLDPNYEVILSIAPDVVIVLASQQQRKAELEELGLETFTVANETLNDVYDSIITIGYLIGKEKDAANLAINISNSMKAIQQKVLDREKRSAAFVFEHGRGALQDIYVAGKDNFINDLIEMAGGYNVFADLGMGYPQVNPEALIERDPEVIFDCTEDGGNPYAEFPELKAVTGNNIHFCFDDFIQKPGPRLVQSLDYLARRLHPEAFEDNG